MPEITLELNNTHSVGLGDNLCLLSFLTLLPPKVSVWTSNENQTYDKLREYIKILRIPQEKLELKKIEHNGELDNTGWPLKVLTDYYKTHSVILKGSPVQINKHINKKYIAVVTAFEEDTSGKNEWPWCRNRPLDYWAKIFAWIKSIGYEVVTLDDPYYSLENKIEILAKDCQAMITYEGGMAHLAHVLDIPCFMVDWKHPSPSTHLNVFHSDFVHRTNSVHILRKDEEIFSWNRLAFDIIVEQLKQGKGNNRFLNDFYFDFVGPGFHNDVRIYNRASNNLLCLQTHTFLGKYHANLISQYYQN